MKNAEQFYEDVKNDPKLMEQFREEMNQLRADDSLDMAQAGILAAGKLGYKASLDDAKEILARMQIRKNRKNQMLSDDELEAVSGGAFACGGSTGGPSCCG